MTGAISLTAGELTITLPGLTAVRIDVGRRLVAVDGLSGTGEDLGGAEWTVVDLRDGAYGDFHRLLPVDECFNSRCATSGQHIAEPIPGGPPFHGAARDGDRSMRDFKCGACGAEFGSNCSPGDISCTECDARLCSRCGNWEGGFR